MIILIFNNHVYSEIILNCLCGLRDGDDGDDAWSYLIQNFKLKYF